MVAMNQKVSLRSDIWVRIGVVNGRNDHVDEERKRSLTQKTGS